MQKKVRKVLLPNIIMLEEANIITTFHLEILALESLEQTPELTVMDKGRAIILAVGHITTGEETTMTVRNPMKITPIKIQNRKALK